MEQSWSQAHNAIYSFVDTLAQRWAAEPETLASPRSGVPPVVVVTDPDQHVAMLAVLEQLGVAGAVSQRQRISGPGPTECRAAATVAVAGGG